MPNFTTNHAITYTNTDTKGSTESVRINYLGVRIKQVEFRENVKCRDKGGC